MNSPLDVPVLFFMLGFLCGFTALGILMVIVGLRHAVNGGKEGEGEG